MSIRLTSIRVNRGGPLTHDFEMDAGDLNLIFGPNESGKTYIVESMISFLFKKDLPVRPWQFFGRAVVEGIDHEPISFTGTATNLEQYMDDAGKGLPQDLSKLLVVRAGDTKLTDHPDGIGRRLLSRLLSGEEMLTEIQDRIPKAVRPAVVENGELIGAKKQGKIKDRLRLRDDLNRLDHLLEKVRRDLSTGTIPSLNLDKKDTENDIRAILLAKRHYAFQLNKKIVDLNTTLSQLPTETQCSKLGTDIGIYRTKTNDRATIQKDLARLEDTTDDHFWVQKALENYKEINASQKPKQVGFIYIILASISFAAVTALGLYGQKIGVAVAAAATTLFYYLYYRERSIFTSNIVDDVEITKLKAEFHRRFSKKLTDIATIQSQAELLNKKFIQSEQLRKQLKEADKSIAAQSINVINALQVYVNSDLSPETWTSELQTLVNTRKQLNIEIDNTNSSLAPLNVPESDYLKRNPGRDWDPDMHTTLDDQIQSIDAKIHEEQKRLDELKDRIAQETELTGQSSWETLLSALNQKRETVAADYRTITSIILAQTQLHAVIQEFQKHETDLITNSLEQPVFTGPLLAITGRYDHISLDNDEIILRDQNHNIFPLKQMSTGAQEQAWLALRLGFASLTMEGQDAFLILDDAFQNSDWKRRSRIVTEAIRLAENGWQIFYFSMDNHISKLFRTKAKKSTASFSEINLGT